MTLGFVEVSPRDGLQNEATILPLADKLELIDRAVKAGAKRIEVASFVNPARVPQMAGAEELIAALPAYPGVETIGLVLNARGVERALATSVHELGLVVAVSDDFAIANQGMSAEDTVVMAEAMLARCAAAGRAAQVTITVSFACPFAGPTDPARVAAIARRLAAAGPREVAIADTIGIARPEEVSALVAAVAKAIAPIPVRAHFHDTRGMGVANALAAVAAGATVLDASIAGVGGCPFAPGAAGNVASEDLAYAFGEAALGLDLEALVDTAEWLGERLGRSQCSAHVRARRAIRS
jgi:hydroxymethylglutaryl-CoA lyase